MQEPDIQACLRGDRMAQKAFFERFKGKMFALCLRYANSREDAEDVLQEGFVRVFRDLQQYSGVGNLEGWVRKIFVNTALQHIEKKRRGPMMVELDESSPIMADDLPYEPDTLPAKHLTKLLQQLAPGFRSVFNLYILEGYTHPEIAEILGISVGTSKSQLLRAKAQFRALFEASLTT
jgi:RNA polymerase sigma factor (sigma-70 family)